MSSSLIDSVRALVTDGGMSRSGLARAAGLHANSLRKLGEAKLNQQFISFSMTRRDPMPKGSATATASAFMNCLAQGVMFCIPAAIIFNTSSTEH